MTSKLVCILTHNSGHYETITQEERFNGTEAAADAGAIGYGGITVLSASYFRLVCRYCTKCGRIIQRGDDERLRNFEIKYDGSSYYLEPGYDSNDFVHGGE